MHEGLRLEFAHKGHQGGGGSQGEGEGGAGAGGGSDEEEGSADESGGARGGWRSGLDALSGGQRTLVSLAFVAAVGGRAAWLGKSAICWGGPPVPGTAAASHQSCSNWL